MRNKRSFTILIVIGLLAVLTTTAYAATSAHPATPSIVGTWKMSIAPSESSPEGLEVLQTFFADGNYMETINIIANRTDTVVGLSNLFAPSEDSVAFWAGCVATAQATFPGLPLVGYESGVDLACAEAVGFEKLQSLRVWGR
jgi:hypothetical protein